MSPARILPAFLAAMLACDYHGVQLVDPPPAPELPLQIRVSTAEADQEAAALGWSRGVPAARVVILTEEGDTVWQGSSDAEGLAEPVQLRPGRYTVEGLKLLTATESTRAGDGSLVGFVERINISVPGDTLIDLALYPSRASGLVISEVYGPGHLQPGVGSYMWATYLELYNNSDEPQSLSGLAVGSGWRTYYHTDPLPCAASRSYRTDPTIYYVDSYSFFPPSAPLLPPGGVLLLATDGIDHSTIDPTWPDLSRADYEFIGPADVDNPEVANLPEDGERAFFSRGIVPLYRIPLLLLRAPPTGSLPTRVTEYNGRRWTAFPTHTIVDFWYDQGMDGLGTLTSCTEPILGVFDRRPGRHWEPDPRNPALGVHRRIIAYRADGRPILQDTRSSYADLQLGARTPGRVGRVGPEFR